MVGRHLIVCLGIGCFLTASASAQLAGHWQLNEGSGTVFADSSPNMNDGFLPQAAKLPEWSTDTPATSFDNPYSLKFDPAARNFVDTTFAGIGATALEPYPPGSKPNRPEVNRSCRTVHEMATVASLALPCESG